MQNEAIQIFKKRIENKNKDSYQNLILRVKAKKKGFGNFLLLRNCIT